MDSNIRSPRQYSSLHPAADDTVSYGRTIGMGWRTDEAFEEAEHEREREFVASLSPRDRLPLWLWQACGVGMVVALFLLMMAFALPARP